MQPRIICPDCSADAEPHVNRRAFIQSAAVAAAAASCAPTLRAAETSGREPEALVWKLHQSLTPDQRSQICFPWDHTDKRGLLRTHVSNNWNITDTKLNVGGSFYTRDQQEMIEAIFYGLYNPEWHDRIRKQLQDDAGGYGKAQTIALFGEPGSDKFELVMTGRHLTIRCDGNTTDHVAFGGPIFYGHAAQGFDEAKDHPGNVFWPQAVKANGLFQMLDGKQRKQALLEEAPHEADVAFLGPDGKFPGIAISDLSSDQKAVVQDVLKLLVEPYRNVDREEALECLDKQGGLDKCSLAFYQSDDIGDDGVWDIWRLEGPSFVWHFRGSPHVHVWANIADDPSVPLNAVG
ncbi:MAG: DUF3500 domain-containing protein [Planctomyces sp.]|nr:DUF3500 domain-containing protein [Planctomyces sp.]